MPHTNRLAQETSPYLLQHAHNPVDWYPWGPEAFEAARVQDKPIFLSVGYSTCYWCHVMERQSFESEAIAEEMNQRFINIKVDREERPDVDQLYMLAVQVLTHHGGWPMSVFLLPDLRPFYGGTYFPPTDMSGRPGFVTILRAIEDAYRNRRADVEKSAQQIHDILSQIARPIGARQSITIDTRQIDDLIRRSTSDYDSVNGGFGTAPKFPRETLLELILSSDQSQIKNPKSQIRHSLDAMANGGIRDHLGGGFHRYSTDAEWLVPHFEIMLYDNAMLGWCYVEAHRQTGEPRYATIARGILDFVLREMTSPDGAFYTAFDAEVDAQEGEPYVWTKERIEEALGSGPDSVLLQKVYGLDRGPNFADPHHGSGVADKNVLYLADGPAMEGDPRIDSTRQKLYEARRQRKQPLLDTKIITSWNGLMIRALAHGAKVLDEPRYLDGASSAATFLLRQHLADDGSLYRTSRDGVRKYHGFLDDYAFLIHGLLALYQASGSEAWRDRAESLAKTMTDKFADLEGGFYFSDGRAKDLIVRQMVASDSPLPSGNGVAARVMMELGEPEVARKAIARFAQQILQQGEGMSAMVLAAGEYVERHGPIEVSAAGDGEANRPPTPQDLAGSVVRLRAQWRNPRELEIQVNILPPFHINGNEPAAGMIGTELHLDEREVERIEYPDGQTYAGDVSIVVRYKTDVTQKQRMAIKYQACDESACLPEIVKQFEVRSPT